MRRFLLSAAVVVFTLAGCQAQKENASPVVLGPNPFITHIYTADPSARVWEDGRLYVYPSHDIDPPKGCDLMDKYHVFLTEDMVNWTDHGQIVEAADVPWGKKPSLAGGATFMWAPDCVYKNGKYYFISPIQAMIPGTTIGRLGLQ